MRQDSDGCGSSMFDIPSKWHVTYVMIAERRNIFKQSLGEGEMAFDPGSLVTPHLGTGCPSFSPLAAVHKELLEHAQLPELGVAVQSDL